MSLAPHPEGGHYRETWRDAPAGGGRGAASAILFLLALDELSAWHRVDADELWVWQAGAPLVLTTSADGHDAAARWLGPDLAARPSLAPCVPRGAGAPAPGGGGGPRGGGAGWRWGRGGGAPPPHAARRPRVNSDPPTRSMLCFDGLGV